MTHKRDCNALNDDIDFSLRGLNNTLFSYNDINSIIYSAPETIRTGLAMGADSGVHV